MAAEWASMPEDARRSHINELKRQTNQDVYVQCYVLYLTKQRADATAAWALMTPALRRYKLEQLRQGPR